MRRFLVIWSVALIGLLLAAGAVNVVVNPYDRFDLPRIRHVNILKPAIKNHAALTKAYQVERARPTTVVLGTSRAYLGVRADGPAWPEAWRPVYNYGLPGTNMSRSLLRELREAWSTGHVRHVVAFIDVPSFFDPDRPVHGEEDEARLAFLDDGAANPGMHAQRLRDGLLSVFTLAALSDSVSTILAQGGGDRVLDLRPDGTSTDADFANAARAEGMHSVFAQKDAADLAAIPEFQRVFADWHGLMPNLWVVRDMIRFCREHDISLILIVGSSHADVMEIFRRSGLWPRVEQLKMDIAGLVAAANSDAITAWDFFEYAPYTTETLPPPGDRRATLRWFWDPVHFSHALGEVMLSRVFTGAPADYGAKLTPDTVRERNEAVREGQSAFVGWRIACETNNQCVVPVGVAAAARR